MQPQAVKGHQHPGSSSMRSHRGHSVVSVLAAGLCLPMVRCIPEQAGMAPTQHPNLASPASPPSPMGQHTAAATPNPLTHPAAPESPVPSVQSVMLASPSPHHSLTPLSSKPLDPKSLTHLNSTAPDPLTPVPELLAAQTVHRDLRAAREEAQAQEQSFQRELGSAQKLSDMYKEMANARIQKCESLEGVLRELKGHLEVLPRAPALVDRAAVSSRCASGSQHRCTYIAYIQLHVCSDSRDCACECGDDSGGQVWNDCRMADLSSPFGLELRSSSCFYSASTSYALCSLRAACLFAHSMQMSNAVVARAAPQQAMQALSSLLA